MCWVIHSLGKLFHRKLYNMFTYDLRHRPFQNPLHYQYLIRPPLLMIFFQTERLIAYSICNFQTKC